MLFMANSILFIYDYTTSDFFQRLWRIVGCPRVCGLVNQNKCYHLNLLIIIKSIIL